jgi:hypothetical protein
MTNDTKLVDRIIKKYGEVINLREHPEVLIDILRQFANLSDDGGAPPGGAPPPPGPSGAEQIIRNEDLMKEILKLQRAVANLRKDVLK